MSISHFKGEKKLTKASNLLYLVVLLFKRFHDCMRTCICVC